MNAKAKKLLNDIHTDLELLGFEDLARRVQQVQKELTPAPRKTKSVSLQKYKVEVTEGFKSFEVIIDGDRELDKFLATQAKSRKASMDQFFKDNDIYIPAWSHRSDDQAVQLEKHHVLIAEAGRNFTLKIQRIQ
jgi:L-lactate utilization protein LutC